MKGNSELYNDVDDLMTSDKSLPMKLTCLTDRVGCQLPNNNNISNDEALKAIGDIASLEESAGAYHQLPRK